MKRWLNVSSGAGHLVGRAARPFLMLAVVCALLAASAVALAASHAVKSGHYSGTTSEGQPISFKVSADGKRVLKFATFIGYDGKCGAGGGPGYSVKVQSIAINSSGHFAASAKGTLKGAAVKVKPIKVRISGHLSGKSGSGSVKKTGAGSHCAPPNQKKNPYAETFSVTGH